MLYFIAERLQKSVVDVERMSMREVQGWLAWFTERTARPDADDDALDQRTLSREQLRSMFS